MSAISEDDFKLIKSVVKNFGKVKLAPGSDTSIPYFQCQFSLLTSKNMFTVPKLFLKTRNVKVPRKLTKEEKEKEKDKASKRKEKEVESKKRKKSSSEKVQSTYGTFYDPVIAAYAIWYAVARNSSWVPGKVKTPVKPGITLDQVCEILAVSIANTCSNPQSAVLQIRPLLNLARTIPDRASLCFSGGDKPQWDVVAYRDNVWAEYTSALQQAKPIGIFVGADVVASHIIAAKQEKEREGKLEKPQILCDNCACQIIDGYINEVIAKRKAKEGKKNDDSSSEEEEEEEEKPLLKKQKKQKQEEESSESELEQYEVVMGKPTDFQQEMDAPLLTVSN